jgi:dTMP kinase
VPSDPTNIPFLQRLHGKFLAFEGPDGSGKTTQYKRFVELCRAAGLTVCDVREPGGTDIGERIRTILLDKACSEMGVRCEMLLYMASRAQLVVQRIRPCLAAGHVVIADRFVASTLAYQGAAGGLPPADIAAVAKVATDGLTPDLNLVYDVDEHTAAIRVGLRPAKAKAGKADGAGAGAAHASLFADRMEDRDVEFRRRVREGYVRLCEQDPARYLKIDASVGPDEVWASTLQGLASRFGG